MPNSAKLTGLMVGVLFVVSACGSDGNNNAAPQEPSSEASPGTVQPVPGGPVVNVSLKDFMFDPKPITTKAGPVTFNVKNDGEAPHTFTLRTTDKKQIGTTKDLFPGEAQTITLAIPPGLSESFCAEAGHESLGMVGTVTGT